MKKILIIGFSFIPFFVNAQKTWNQFELEAAFGGLVFPNRHYATRDKNTSYLYSLELRHRLTDQNPINVGLQVCASSGVQHSGIIAIFSDYKFRSKSCLQPFIGLGAGYRSCFIVTPRNGEIDNPTYHGGVIVSRVGTNISKYFRLTLSCNICTAEYMSFAMTLGFVVGGK